MNNREQEIIEAWEKQKQQAMADPENSTIYEGRSLVDVFNDQASEGVITLEDVLDLIPNDKIQDWMENSDYTEVETEDGACHVVKY